VNGRKAEAIEHALRVVHDVSNPRGPYPRRASPAVTERRRRDRVVPRREQRHDAAPHPFAAQDAVQENERRSFALADH
jgi:hypothetical protein